MPSISSPHIQISTHTTAADVLAAVQHVILPHREREANIWMPHARKISKTENSHQATGSLPKQFWLSVWTVTRSGTRTLDLVLACTANQLGDYPIFLYSNVPASQLTPTFLNQRISLLIERLLELVSPTRVFSVFSPSALTSAFVSSWTRRTGSIPEIDPFYAAKFTTCTKKTITPAPAPLPAGDEMRLATAEDAERAATLCKEFADDSVYFPLSYPRALKEAREMIRNRQLWVYYTTLASGQRELASIVACTRTTENVAAITKVYTNPLCRSRGCAERLVRRVTNFWLNEAGRQSVVLFVAHDNAPAEKVYHRVGFQGLQGCTAEGVEDWLEVGFVNTDRGHW
ncbi:hypothetical protein FRB99_004791 [Tulasnella sp. 403]|nr:hypothetical protein FRB99_004791 [Tulasnella sp. 403]